MFVEKFLMVVYPRTKRSSSSNLLKRKIKGKKEPDEKEEGDLRLWFGWFPLLIVERSKLKYRKMKRRVNRKWIQLGDRKMWQLY